MKNQQEEKYYKYITFGDNRTRLKLLTEFRELVIQYFDNSTLNMVSGIHSEQQEAREARDALSLIIKRAYNIIRLADVKTSAISNSSIIIGRQFQNIDLILNIFNLGRNNIPQHVAIELIEKAIDVYKSNRLDSFIRTINPFFWVRGILRRIIGGFKKEGKQGRSNLGKQIQ